MIYIKPKIILVKYTTGHTSGTSFTSGGHFWYNLWVVMGDNLTRLLGVPDILRQIFERK